jgi:hypothetical protein
MAPILSERPDRFATRAKLAKVGINFTANIEIDVFLQIRHGASEYSSWPKYPVYLSYEPYSVNWKKVLQTVLGIGSVETLIGIRQRIAEIVADNARGTPSNPKRIEVQIFESGPDILSASDVKIGLTWKRSALELSSQPALNLEQSLAFD